MPTSVTVLPVIEATQAMQTAGFGTTTSINVQSFISDLQPGDAVAVTSFAATPAVVFAPNNQPATVDSQLQVIAQANAAVQAVPFTGTGSDLGAALTAAYSMISLGPAGNLPGVLLVSLGQAGGADPLQLPSYQPTYVCAPGPGANLSLLQQIAVISQGAYYYAPSSDDQMTILNQIHARLSGWQTVVNDWKAIDPDGFWLRNAPLASGLAKAQVAVAWEDPTYVYTHSPVVGPNQISITLVTPIGIVSPLLPSSTGPGWAVFDLTTPIAGTWQVQIMYPGATALSTTVAVFALPTTTAQAPRLTLTAPAGLRAGAPLAVVATLSSAAEPVELLSATAMIVQPGAGGQDHERQRQLFRAPGSNHLTIPLAPQARCGGHTVRLEVEGRFVGSGQRFALTEIVSATVAD